MITGKKCFLLALQCLVLLIGALMVYALVAERDSLNEKVAREISSGWGPAQIVDGPYMSIEGNSSRKYYPKNFVCNANVSTQTLHKGIYSAVVYESEINFSAVYDGLFSEGGPQLVTIQIDLETDFLQDLGPLVINGENYEWDRETYYIFKTFPSHMLTGKLDISTSLTLKGSQNLRINEVGEHSKIVMSGNANDPAFIWGRIPAKRALTDDTFEAEWISVNKASITTKYHVVGTEFLTGLDSYKKVARSLKYAILIILFTYCSVIFTEIVTKKNIPLLNYFLIGVALIIFYTLLLSFVEWMPFFWAYLLASIMIIGMISIYIYRITDSKKVGEIIALILAVIYIGCYVMLVSSAYALLLGSLALFGALSAMMYASLRMKDKSPGLNP